MNFLKSVLSSAVGGFPGYTIQDSIEVPPNCLYTLNNATKREDNSLCSVLTFETSKAPSLLPLARNYHTKLRSLKHPGIVKYLDSLEVDGYIYIATERIAPLAHTLARNPSKDVLSWGLFDVAQTIAFINSEAKSIHGNIRGSSIYTTEAGEWKVAGFEALTTMKDDDPFICKYGSSIPDIYVITPPELQNKGFSELQNQLLTSIDSWQFAGLIWSLYNGTFSSSSSLQGQGKIPSNMFAQYRRLLSPNAQSRLPVANFVDFGRRPGCFFRTDLIEVSEAIPSLPLKPRAEVEAFLNQNMETFAALPTGFTKNRLLPEMIKSFEFGGGGQTALNAILTIAKDLAPTDQETLVAPMLLRLWSSKDRATHLVLLENLKYYVTFLSPKQINDKLFHSVGTCFTDPAPIMRETAIRQVLILTPHLTDRNINGDLLKYLAKTANDQQPGIRTNTTICLGKISTSLGPSHKRKVLTAAFSRSLKDPFAHARLAALQAIHATSEVYEKEDLANRILPAIVTLLIDGQRDVREQAKKTLTSLLVRIEELTSNMPDLVVPAAQGSVAVTSNGAGSPAIGGAIETAGVWAGWAVSAMSRNIDSSSPGPVTTSSSLPVSRSVTPAAVSPPNKQSTTVAKLKAERPQTTRASSSGVGTRGGLKLVAKPNTVDLSAIYTEELSSEGEAWGEDDWDDDPAPTSSATKVSPAIQPTKIGTSGLAKPLAKSTAKVMPKPKKAVPLAKDNKKNVDDGNSQEDWDTDAWFGKMI